MPLSPDPDGSLIKGHLPNQTQLVLAHCVAGSNGGFLSPIKPQPALLGVFLPLPRTDAMDMPGEDEYVYGYEYEFDLENPFTSPADEPIASLLDAEGHHAPSVSAAASAVRRDAARFISKVRVFLMCCSSRGSFSRAVRPLPFLIRSASVGPGAVRRGARRAPAGGLPRAELRGSLPLQRPIAGKKAKDGVFLSRIYNISV